MSKSRACAFFSNEAVSAVIPGMAFAPLIASLSIFLKKDSMASKEGVYTSFVRTRIAFVVTSRN